MDESLGQSEQNVTPQISLKPNCKDLGHSEVSRIVPGGQVLSLQPGLDEVPPPQKTRGGPAFPMGQKESTRGLFFSHTRRERLFLRSILRIKMQKPQIKQKNKAKRQDYFLDNDKCWVTMQWIHNIYFLFHVKLIWTGRALNKKVDIVKLPWTLLQYSIPIYI